jgi:hypothetical protein
MKNIILVPFYKTWYENKIFSSSFGRDNFLEPYIYLRKYFEDRGYTMNTPDIIDVRNASHIIFLDIDLKIILKAFIYGSLGNSMYIQFEPPVVNDIHSYRNLKMISGIFPKILTWNDDLIDNRKFYKFMPPVPHNHNQDDNIISFEDRKLLTNISGYKLSNYKNELYSKRIEAIEYFQEHSIDNFDLYGVGWDKAKYPSYKGEVENKYEILRKYKFSLCFENMHNINGLISEKIFDCFYAQCIPIFWGAENIHEYIPETCYIDMRKFSTYEDLMKYISNMTKEEFNFRVNSIKKFLESSEFENFLPEGFAENIYEVLTEKKRKFGIISFIGSIIYFSFYKVFKKIVKSR